jgi:hypothetical protein
MALPGHPETVAVLPAGEAMKPLVLCLLCSIAYGEETPCTCPPDATNGAREGETLEARIARLERESAAKATALRLARAEAKVARKGRR